MAASTQPRPDRVAEEILDAYRDEPNWIDAFAEHLDRHRASHALERILSVWDLNRSDAANLFGVSRQAVSKWLKHGVPAERAVAIGNLAAATDVLVRYLRRERIPAVVRRAAGALGDMSLVELAARDRSADVLDACRTMFDMNRAQT